MPYNNYLQISEERYNLLCKRFDEFMLDVDDVNKEPFKLFEPLNAVQNQELELIREVSMDLQNKKEEDNKKVEAAIKEKNATKTKKQSIKTEETNETENKETEETTVPVQN